MMEKELQNIVTDKQSNTIDFDNLGHLQSPILSSNKILCLPKSLFASYHLNAPEFYSTFKLFVLKLRLKNERRLMGSDVPSPTMTHILRQWVSVADYFSFTIGEWLEMTQHTKRYLETLSTKISWLGKEDPSGRFNALLED